MPEKHRENARLPLQPLLTIEETAEILHLSRSAIYALIKHEGLPSFTIGNSRRIHPEDLAQWINQRKRLPETT